jgi:hypothetical protein
MKGKAGKFVQWKAKVGFLKNKKRVTSIPAFVKLFKIQVKENRPTALRHPKLSCPINQ